MHAAAFLYVKRLLLQLLLAETGELFFYLFHITVILFYSHGGVKKKKNQITWRYNQLNVSSRIIQFISLFDAVTKLNWTA